MEWGGGYSDSRVLGQMSRSAPMSPAFHVLGITSAGRIEVGGGGRVHVGVVDLDSSSATVKSGVSLKGNVNRLLDVVGFASSMDKGGWGMVE